MKHFMETIQIEDPRQQHKVKHTLQDVIGLVLIATLAVWTHWSISNFLVNAMQRH